MFIYNICWSTKATQDKEKPPQKASIPNPKLKAVTFKVDEEKQIPQPIVNTTIFDPIQDQITGIEADPNDRQLHSPAAHMFKDNSS